MASTARSTARRPSSSTASRSTSRSRRSSSSSRPPSSPSTRRSRPTCGSGSTRATPTRWSAARSSSRTAPARVVRVAVFAQGEKAQEALRAGADEVGGEDLVKKIEAGWLEFDVALATPDSMGLVGKLGKILGRRGLMPNPKAGHDHLRHRARGQGGQGRPRRVQVDKTGDRPRRRRQEQLRAATRCVDNLAALVDAVNRAKPAGAKGQYLKTLTIASTMGPGIRVDVPGVLAAAAALTHPPAVAGHQPRWRPRGASSDQDRRTAADSLRPRTAATRGSRRSGLDPPDRTGRRRRGPGTTTSTPRQIGAAPPSGGPRPCELGSTLAERPPGTSQGPPDRSIGRPPPHAGRVPKDRRATCPRRPNGRRSPSCARNSPTPGR